MNELKILHTSDWHLGVTSWTGSKPVDRTSEILKALDEIYSKTLEFQPDIVLITGDILHVRNNPSVESVESIIKYLKNFSDVAPVVVVLGNHDWKGLRSLKELKLENLRIVDKPEVFELTGKKGQRIKVFPLPYVETSSLISRIDNRDERIEKLHFEIEKLMKRYEKEATADWNIMVAHVLVDGLKISGIEKKTELVMKRQMFPGAMDYIALGHFHGVLKILETPPTWYCGSPIYFDFGELKERKGALMVKLIKGEEPQVDKIETSVKKLKIVRLKSKGLKALEELEEEIRGFDGYVKVVLDDRDLIGEIFGRFENVVKIDWEREESEIPHQDMETKGIDFFDMYEEFVKTRYPEISDEMLKEMKKILEEVEE